MTSSGKGEWKAIVSHSLMIDGLGQTSRLEAMAVSDLPTRLTHSPSAEIAPGAVRFPAASSRSTRREGSALRTCTGACLRSTPYARFGGLPGLTQRVIRSPHFSTPMSTVVTIGAGTSRVSRSDNGTPRLIDAAWSVRCARASRTQVQRRRPDDRTGRSPARPMAMHEP